MFQRFTVIVNNMRANVVVLLYDDHDRAVKLLHSLDCTVWSGKVEAILESEKYETLIVDELFSKLKSSEVDHGVHAKIESLTDAHSLALIPRSRTNANMS
jgi:DNA replication protein DnaC